MSSRLIDLLNGRSSTAGTSSSTASSGSHVRHAARCTTASLVQLGDDGVAHSLNLLLFVVEFLNLSKLVGIQPFDSLVTLVVDLLAVFLNDLVLQLLVLNGSL